MTKHVVNPDDWEVWCKVSDSSDFHLKKDWDIVFIKDGNQVVIGYKAAGCTLIPFDMSIERDEYLSDIKGSAIWELRRKPKFIRVYYPDIYSSTYEDTKENREALNHLGFSYKTNNC